MCIRDSFKSLQDVGVTVNAAAGNHYTAGYGNTSGKNLPFASDPDSCLLYTSRCV